MIAANSALAFSGYRLPSGRLARATLASAKTVTRPSSFEVTALARNGASGSRQSVAFMVPGSMFRVQSAGRAGENGRNPQVVPREGRPTRSPRPTTQTGSQVKRYCISVVADEARAFWIATPGRGEIRAETLPAPAADEVVVRALFSGVSRGTEALVFQGRVPVSEHARMRAPFQIGTFPAPVKYGYASVGTVEHGPADLQGRRVFTLFPHQTRYVVPARSVTVVP